MPQVFNYDVFISYKSEQESWAIRLADTLRSLGATVWRDHDAGDGLRVSDRWRPEIQNAIRRSRRMIVLWSEAIDRDSIVLRELDAMQHRIDDEPDAGRAFVPISLDGTSVAAHPILGPYHAEHSFRALYDRYGDGGGAQVSAIDWAPTLKNVIEALGIEGVMELRFAVAAMTREQAEQLAAQPEQWAQDAAVFTALRDLMQQTRSFDTARYGASPDHWRPFPELEDDPDIRTFIDEYDLQKRRWLRGDNEHAKWIVIPYSEAVLSDDAKRRAWAGNQIRGGPSLIVVDPVSMLHKTVYQRVMTELGIHNLEEAYVIGIAPYALRLHEAVSAQVTAVEQQLEGFLQPAYQRFQTFFECGARICVLGVDHEYQLARWLQVAADRVYEAQKTPMRMRRLHPSQHRRFRRRTPAPGAAVVRMGVEPQ